ncbi:MAG: PspC domain-containing protein [Burkholderiaceae bacterium]|nr:PspC domain-containing protein [Roseateles sp.]MBV8468868.1 PspC domain-containing protein [Burkholderiaceae bacterium]
MSDSEELAKLGELHRSGVLSDEEFARAKAKLLNATYQSNSNNAGTGTALQSLKRSRTDCWLGGVCGGLAEATDMPSWVWRLLFVLLMVCAGSGILFYLLLWFFVPQEASA